MYPIKTQNQNIKISEQIKYISWLEKKLLLKIKDNHSSKIAIKFKPKPKLLLIDKVAKQRYSIKAKISSLDLDIIEAFDNYIGLQLASLERVDLIAIDISNYQDLLTISRLRRIPNCSGSSIIATSFSNSKTLHKECLKRGSDLFLVKPIEADYLVNNLNFFLNLSPLKVNEE